MKRTALAWAALVGSASLLECAGSGHRETTALAAAVDRYRRAADPVKAAEAEAVGRVACSDEKVCAAKSACIAAIDPTTRALAIKDEVTHRLADLQQNRITPASAEAQALPDKLDQATRLLGEGRTKMADCDKQLTDLEVTYGR
ncbi:MAG TPA: hypothetical protein VGM06_22715 [Polyangiaceae bacterium]|jgi:hypothetical protein